MQFIKGHPGKMAEAPMVLDPFPLMRQFGLCHEAVVAGKVMGTSEGVQQVMFQAQEVQDLTRDDLPFGGPFVVQVFWKSHDSELSFQVHDWCGPVLFFGGTGRMELQQRLEVKQTIVCVAIPQITAVVNRTHWMKQTI